MEGRAKRGIPRWEQVGYSGIGTGRVLVLWHEGEKLRESGIREVGDRRPCRAYLLV